MESASHLVRFCQRREGDVAGELKGGLCLMGGESAIGLFRDNQPFVTQELDLIRSG